MLSEGQIAKHNFDNEESAKISLEEIVSKNELPAILCKAKDGNPNFLSIIFANQKFYEDFNISESRLIGKNYDFLFDDLDLDYSSEEQMEFIRLIKAVKDFHPCSIIVSPANHNFYNLDKIRLKIDFYPQENFRNYAIFTFAKIANQNESAEEAKTESSQKANIILLRNLERSLRNERLMREIGNLIISDLQIDEIAKNIARSLCLHLKVDRCLIHDYKEGSTSFIVEHSLPEIKEMFRGADDESSIKTLTKYLNFQDHFYEKFGNKNGKSSISIIENVLDDVNFTKIHDVCKEYKIVSQIAVSTMISGKLSGGIYLHQSSKRTWLHDEIELIETVADQMAIAFDRSMSIERIMTTNHALMEKTAQLREALKHEQEMRKMQNDFIALVSHEFKTPLQIIDGTREVLIRKTKNLGDLKESFDKGFDRIKSAVRRMTGLINSTLNLAKMESGEGDIRLEKSEFNFKEFILDIIEKNQLLATNKNIKILSRIDELPEKFIGDSKLLDHSFSNIISNALKYSKENSCVKIIAKCLDEKLAIRVIDQGIGIPQDDLKNIGKKFFRASNTLSFAGTGIGFHLTRHFIEMHGGNIEIDSVLDVGTKVTTTLPIIKI